MEVGFNGPTSYKHKDIMLEHIRVPERFERPQLTELPKGFNWIAILKDLKAGAPIDFDDQWKLERLASMWPTCACGQLCQALPKTPIGAPRDEILRGLGTRFMDLIEVQQWSKALETFHEIEARTMVLLKRNGGDRWEWIIQ